MDGSAAIQSIIGELLNIILPVTLRRLFGISNQDHLRLSIMKIILLQMLKGGRYLVLMDLITGIGQIVHIQGSSPGEMVFRWNPIFIGDSYIMSPEFPAAANSFMWLSFNYYEDWWSDTVVVGCAYTMDNGNTWTSIWELHATGNVGPEAVSIPMYAPGNFRLGFYYKGDSNNIDFFYIDDLTMTTTLTVAYPPSFLEAMADTTNLKVNLQWNPGSSPFPAPITGYQLQRKDGLPTNSSSYQTIANVDSLTFSFEDQNVELNKLYTYRICTVFGLDELSSYGNEATAYVPASIPVELISFTGAVSGNEVTLEWITATELNNQGFEVERTSPIPSPYQGEGGEAGSGWESIGFVPGNGTTTEQNAYVFIDKDLKANKYLYRLKQIDFDGTFEYSDEIEILISAPTEFSLEQNYPNPFNPTTKIRYSIPSGETHRDASLLVTLKVYDVLGNEVATLVKEEKTAGSYEVEFNTSSINHHPSSGVYFYTLSSGNYLSTKKMILLR